MAASSLSERPGTTTLTAECRSRREGLYELFRWLQMLSKPRLQYSRPFKKLPNPMSIDYRMLRVPLSYCVVRKGEIKSSREDKASRP